MKTLVTGATGFIGRHLVNALVNEGREVRCVVRGKSNTERLEKLGVEIVCADLLEKVSLLPALQGVSIIYHLAGEVYSSKVTDYFKYNVEGTRNLIESCNGNSIERFIYCSSIAAAGPNPDNKTLLTEKDSCKPITPYGISKYETEKIVLGYSKQNKIPAVIIRPPTIYGPGQSKIITDFFLQVRKGKFYVMGTGEYLRSLCYIENLIEGILLAEKNPAAVGEIFYLSDRKVYTFKEIVQTLADVQGVNLTLIKLPPIVAHLAMSLFSILYKFININILKLYTIGIMGKNLGCSIAKAEDLLSFNPKIGLKDGIHRTIQYLKLINELN
jgi:nucleoside-diphosphate-sugar epimerase